MVAEKHRVVVATGNAGKLAEISASRALPGWEFVNAADLGAETPEIEETGDSFTENAFLKASAYHTLFGLPALALSLIHISEPTRLGMISYAVFCLKKKKK